MNRKSMSFEISHWTCVASLTSESLNLTWTWKLQILSFLKFKAMLPYCVTFYYFGFFIIWSGLAGPPNSLFCFEPHPQIWDLSSSSILLMFKWGRLHITFEYVIPWLETLNPTSKLPNFSLPPVLAFWFRCLGKQWLKIAIWRRMTLNSLTFLFSFPRIRITGLYNSIGFVKLFSGSLGTKLKVM